VCRDVEELLRPRADGKGLSFSVRVAEGMPGAVIGDPSRLRQVLFNLVGNAIKFTSEGGVILESEWRPGSEERGELEIRIRDTGIGIPEGQQERIFTAFGQADASTTRRFGGTGLGLSICKSLAEAMGGNIRVSSRPGKGSEFALTLPLARASGDWSAVPPQAARIPDGDDAGKPSLPVLVVEDQPVNRMVAQQMLERLGCRVQTAGSGLEAVEKASSRDYAAILMDCRMPGMDGYQAAAAIRALPGSRGAVPIIAVTAEALDRDRQRCLDAGMDDFLSKPIRRPQLAAALRKWAVTSKVRKPDGLRPAEGTADPGPFRKPAGADPVDKAQLAETAGMDGEIDPAMLGALAGAYLETAPETLASLDAAASRGDADVIVRLAHGFQGANAQIGAVSMAALCERLEASAFSDGSESRKIVAELAREFARVEDELRRLVAALLG
jgi:CheY-like chemotaxis protein/HPt (histidine-containing phosphotransfer) domain-containing protein